VRDARAFQRPPRPPSASRGELRDPLAGDPAQPADLDATQLSRADQVAESADGAASGTGGGRLHCVLLCGQRGAGLGEKVALGWPILADEPDDEVADFGVGVLGEPVGGLADVAGDEDMLGRLGGDAVAVSQPADERVARSRLGWAEEGRRTERDGGLGPSMAGGEAAEPPAG
jgi:hypothetical protein